MSEKEFIEQVVDHCRRNTDIQACAIYGSYVIGEHKPTSDLDMIVFTDHNAPRRIVQLAEAFFQLYQNNSPMIYPSINIWSTEEIRTVLPYYMTCLTLGNFKAVYDKGQFRATIAEAQKHVEDGSFARVQTGNGSAFWRESHESNTLATLADSYRKKYRKLCQYIPLFVSNGDYALAIESCAKAAYYLVFLFTEQNRLHAKSMREIYLIHSDCARSSEQEFSNRMREALKKRFELEVFKKRITPFDHLATKESALEACEILDRLREICESSEK